MEIYILFNTSKRPLAFNFPKVNQHIYTLNLHSSHQIVFSSYNSQLDVIGE